VVVISWETSLKAYFTTIRDSQGYSRVNAVTMIDTLAAMLIVVVTMSIAKGSSQFLS
jgi:hypothetical protein